MKIYCGMLNFQNALQLSENCEATILPSQNLLWTTFVAPYQYFALDSRFEAISTLNANYYFGDIIKFFDPTHHYLMSPFCLNDESIDLIFAIISQKSKHIACSSD